MTLVVAWVRKVGSIEELVIASDSRLTSGKAWDCCPKIKILERGDSVISFAGDTDYAYPMMEQVSNAIRMYPKYSTRAADITDVRGHLCRLTTNMREFLHNSIEPHKKFKAEPPGTSFIFAGYSWKLNRFEIWKIHFKKSVNAYIHHSPRTIMRNKIAVLVDASNFKKKAEEQLTVGSIRKRIYDRLEEKGKKSGDGFDMEPFEVLREIIRNDEDWAIGGTPQIVKIYKHMNAMPYGVFWPDKQSKQITILGRPLLSYEGLRYPILDPDTFELSFMRVANSDFNFSHDDGKFDKHREIRETRDTSD